MSRKKERTTTATTARGMSRQLYLSGEVIDGLTDRVPDGQLGITLAAGESRIVLIDDPAALRYVFGLLDALVQDGSEWRRVPSRPWPLRRSTVRRLAFPPQSLGPPPSTSARSPQPSAIRPGALLMFRRNTHGT